MSPSSRLTAAKKAAAKKKAAAAKKKAAVAKKKAALPGWTGYIKHRGANQSLWQKKYPIDLEQYLAVRLWSAKQLGMELLPETKATETDHEMMELQHIWLKAWEKSCSGHLKKLSFFTKLLKKK